VRASAPPWRLTPSLVLGLSEVAALPHWGSTANATFGALRRDGSLNTWGIGSRGELGDGGSTNRPSPAQVARLTDATRLVVGIQHLCAVRADASLSCWGAGASGELGDGSRTDASSPVSVAGVAGVVDVALGPDVSVALRRDGSLSLWGQSRWLLNSAQSYATPVALPALDGATQVIAVMPHDWRQVCALQRGGRVSCLGANLPRVGAWFDMDLEDVTQIAGSPAAVGCARHGDGTVSCWGNNRNACLGDPSLPHADAYLKPQRVRTRDGTLFDRVRSVRPGIGKVCAVREDDTLWCWGAADNGVLGRGLTQWSATPRGVLGL
jgi:alpha-tubulin suppressor-like RCC1 family protein